MTFRNDIERFRTTVRARSQALHDGVVALAQESIVEGSAITGAPGQPVKTGVPPGADTLKGSWRRVPLGPLSDAIMTDVDYARDIEDGARNGRALILRSRIGGFHSVRLTVVGWSRIVGHVLRQMTGAS